MKKYIFAILFVVALYPLYGYRLVHGDDTEIYQATRFESSVFILFNTPGSVASTLCLDAFDPLTDDSTLLFPQGKQVVFARETNNSHLDHHRVSYWTTEGNLLLKYRNYTDPANICSGTVDYQIQWSEADGYFYFDRLSGAFITQPQFDPGNPDHIKIFLPYATRSGDLPSSTGSYSTWCDYNYRDWIFYYSTQPERDALKTMRADLPQRDLLTRILTAKKAIKNLFNSTLGGRFGLLKFNGTSGGLIVADIPSSNTAINASIDGLSADGGTPLAEAVEGAWDWFGDENSFNEGYWCRKDFGQQRPVLGHWILDTLGTGNGHNLRKACGLHRSPRRDSQSGNWSKWRHLQNVLEAVTLA